MPLAMHLGVWRGQQRVHHSRRSSKKHSRQLPDDTLDLGLSRDGWHEVPARPAHVQRNAPDVDLLSSRSGRIDQAHRISRDAPLQIST